MAELIREIFTKEMLAGIGALTVIGLFVWGATVVFAEAILWFIRRK